MTTPSVELPQVLRWRMRRHFLDGPRGRTLVAVARRVAGVHAQVAASAVAALGLRAAGGTDAAAVDAALYRRRTLVRTWAARGTLHLLPAADLPTWVAAMSTRTRETTGSWLRYHGVTAEQMADILAAMPDVLGSEPLTRQELTDALVKATGHGDLAGALNQGFGALLKPAAFRGLLCSGPPRGRNVTFVAPRRWLPDRPETRSETDTDRASDTDGAVDALVLAHLGAYGPADAAEFSRWFDLNPPLAKKTFARLAARGAITEVAVAGTVGAVPSDALPDLTAGSSAEPVVRLLPAFDPYVVGSLRQLDLLVPPTRKKDVSRPQGWISPTLVADGRILGVWAGAGETLTVTPFEALPAAVLAAVRSLAPAATVNPPGPAR